VRAVDEPAAREVRRALAVTRTQRRPARLLFAALARATGQHADADVPQDLLEPRPLEALAALLASPGDPPDGATLRARGGAAPAAKVTIPRRRLMPVDSLQGRARPEGLEPSPVPRRPPQDGPDRQAWARAVSLGRPPLPRAQGALAPAMPAAAPGAGVARAGPAAVPMTRQRLALVRAELRRSVLEASGRPAVVPPQRRAAPSGPVDARPQVPIAPAAPWWSDEALVEEALREMPGSTRPGRRRTPPPEPPREGPPGSGDTAAPAAGARGPHGPAARASSAPPTPLAAGGPAVSPGVAEPALPAPSLAPLARPGPRLLGEDDLAELACLHGVDLSWP
jgi:hypothetical protein